MTEQQSHEAAFWLSLNENAARGLFFLNETVTPAINSTRLVDVTVGGREEGKGREGEVGRARACVRVTMGAAADCLLTLVNGASARVKAAAERAERSGAQRATQCFIINASARRE